MLPDEHLGKGTKEQCARVLDVKPGRVDEYVKEGLPRERDGRRFLYDLALCAEWKREHYPPADSDRRISWEEARTRRETAQAQLAELDLARKRNEQILVSDVETELRPRMERVRLRALNAPGKYATRWQPCKNHGQAQRILEDIMHEVLEDFRVGWVEDDGNRNGKKRKETKRAKRKPRRTRK